jgi:three-Cys-motif partner protein
MCTPVVGSWAERKYTLVSEYARMFTTAMHAKWGSLSYIDLFAGAGRAIVKPSRRLVHTTPTLAIQLQRPFDQYVFCEIENATLAALETRIKRDYPAANATFILGDSNQTVSHVLNCLPTPSKAHTTLALCVVDPFAIRSLKFDTIQALAQRYMDFLILIPAYMDAQRNRARYLSPADNTVDEFLGTDSWRALWPTVIGQRFGTFVADRFGVRMASINYLYAGLSDMVVVRHPVKNFPLYRIAFFSRHELAHKFWNEAKRASQAQLQLFGEDAR